MLTTLVRLRLRFFQGEVRENVRRYQQLWMLLGTLFGLPILYNPEIPGLPILNLFRPDVSLADRLVGEWIFFAALWAWMALMRSGAQGGEGWRYLQSMPIPRITVRLTEIAIATVALGVVWISILVAAARWQVFVPNGLDPRTAWMGTGAIAVLSVALAHALVASRRRIYFLVLLLIGSSLGALPEPGLTPWMREVLIALTLASSIASLLWSRERQPLLAATRGTVRTNARIDVLNSALAIQIKTLFSLSLGSTLGRIVLGFALAWSAAWQAAHNLQPDVGRMMQHLLLGAAGFVLAGLHRSLWDARKPYLPYLRSFACGVRTLVMRDHFTILLLSLLTLTSGFLRGAQTSTPGSVLSIASLMAFYCALTSLLGFSAIRASQRESHRGRQTFAQLLLLGVGVVKSAPQEILLSLLGALIWSIIGYNLF